jgi:hypothetical protein
MRYLFNFGYSRVDGADVVIQECEFFIKHLGITVALVTEAVKVSDGVILQLD